MCYINKVDTDTYIDIALIMTQIHNESSIRQLIIEPCWDPDQQYLLSEAWLQFPISSLQHECTVCHSFPDPADMSQNMPTNEAKVMIARGKSIVGSELLQLDCNRNYEQVTQ